MQESDTPVNLNCLSNGAYRWCCKTDPVWYRKRLGRAFRVCADIAIAVAAVGVGVYLFTKSLPILVVCGISALGFLALSGLIFGLTLLIFPDPSESYTLGDTYVRTGSGRYATWFMFKDTRRLTIRKDCVVLQGRLNTMRVYVPEEDFAFVRDFIRRRMPDEAEIDFE